RTALPAQWRPIAMVSAGEVVTAVDGAVTTASVDASAGGMASAADNPYIYVDLESGAKADINDVESFSSTDWDIALKRSSVRANGGDSGPGDVAVSMVEAASLDEVTELPGADT